MVAATIFLMFYLDLQDAIDTQGVSWRRVGFFIVFGSISVMVAWSRVLCGVHSLDQIVFGYLLGLYFAFILLETIFMERKCDNRCKHQNANVCWFHNLSCSITFRVPTQCKRNLAVPAPALATRAHATPRRASSRQVRCKHSRESAACMLPPK